MKNLALIAILAMTATLSIANVEAYYGANPTAQTTQSQVTVNHSDGTFSTIRVDNNGNGCVNNSDGTWSTFSQY